MKPKNSLNAWVKAQGGAIAVARQLGVTPHAVNHWLRGQGRPKAITMREIVKRANGSVTYNDLIYIGYSTKTGKKIPYRGPRSRSLLKVGR